jgi:putative addiction module component (TIGR02574 family)
MASAVRQIESKALKLSPVERARLAERLISSLDEEVDADAEVIWVREAERRLGELRAGKVRGKAAATVFRRVRSALR